MKGCWLSYHDDCRRTMQIERYPIRSWCWLDMSIREMTVAGYFTDTGCLKRRMDVDERRWKVMEYFAGRPSESRWLRFPRSIRSGFVSFDSNMDCRARFDSTHREWSIESVRIFKWISRPIRTRMQYLRSSLGQQIGEKKLAKRTCSTSSVYWGEGWGWVSTNDSRHMHDAFRPC